MRPNTFGRTLKKLVYVVNTADRTDAVSMHSSGILVTIRDEVPALEGSTLTTVWALVLSSLYLGIVFTG
jgi:hypothetical protein